MRKKESRERRTSNLSRMKDPFIFFPLLRMQYGTTINVEFLIFYFKLKKVTKNTVTWTMRWVHSLAK